MKAYAPTPADLALFFAVEAATKRLARHAAREAALVAQRDEAVRAAFAAGVPVRYLQEAAKVGRQRIYQIRDGRR